MATYVAIDRGKLKRKATYLKSLTRCGVHEVPFVPKVGKKSSGVTIKGKRSI